MYTIEVNTNAGETFRLDKVMSHVVNDNGYALIVTGSKHGGAPVTHRYSGIKSVRVTNFRLGAMVRA